MSNSLLEQVDELMQWSFISSVGISWLRKSVTMNLEHSGLSHIYIAALGRSLQWFPSHRDIFMTRLTSGVWLQPVGIQKFVTVYGVIGSEGDGCVHCVLARYFIVWWEIEWDFKSRSLFWCIMFCFIQRNLYYTNCEDSPLGGNCSHMLIAQWPY